MLDKTATPEKLRTQFPVKAQSLFEPAPYKVMYGGRGGSKTWNFCRALLILGFRKKLFILCARELQKSIADSVHRILSMQLDPLGLHTFYTVMQHKIVGKNGTEFVFYGIKNNINAIKSMEAIDVCAVFEANGVSAHSWDVLLPTVRRDPPHGPFGCGSEIWIEFNPELATDETYKRWVLNPPDPAVHLFSNDEVEKFLRSKHDNVSAIVTEVNWSDNRWFPEILEAQKEQMRVRDYENYLTVWEGKVRRVVQGAIYAKELGLAHKENRVSPTVRLDRSRAVDVSCDLGRADTCAIWFVQQIGTEHRFIDYCSGFGEDWGYYLTQIQKRGYLIGKIYLPHDAEAELLAAKKSIYMQTRDAYPNSGQVIVVPRTPSVVNDINQVRLMFRRFFFAEQACADGLQALSHYRYEIDEETREVSPKPLHDWACVTGDTEVLTRNGLKCISALPENGEVLTPCGWKAYRLPRITRRNAPLVEITFDDGHTVNCTAEHLFLTASGWKCAVELYPTMPIRSSLTISRSIGMAAFIGFGRVAHILRGEGGIFISKFGKQCLAYGQKAFISIIEMTIQSIIGLKIWNVCQQMSICVIPINSVLPKEHKFSLSTQRPGRKLQHGIAQKQGDFGTNDMQSAIKLGKNGSEKLNYAWNVIKNLKRLFGQMDTARNSVLRYAKRDLRVVSVKRLDKTSDVWCLTVDDGAWWSLVNGAVVHNSHAADALRCYAMGLAIGDRYRRAQIHQPSSGPDPGSIPRGQRWMQ